MGGWLGGGGYKLHRLANIIFHSKLLSGRILTLVMLNKLRCNTNILIFSQSDYLVQVVDTNSHT